MIVGGFQLRRLGIGHLGQPGEQEVLPGTVDSAIPIEAAFCEPLTPHKGESASQRPGAAEAPACTMPAMVHRYGRMYPGILLTDPAEPSGGSDITLRPVALASSASYGVTRKQGAK